MTETTKTDEAPRCRWGSASDNPCWREAVTKHSDDDRDGPPRLCEEHRHASESGRKAEDLQSDLDAVQEFLNKLLDRAEDELDGGYRLRDILYRQREELEREYLEAHVKAEAAWRVADRGPDEEPLDLADMERVMAQFIRSDALSTALMLLEDLPDESYGPHAARYANPYALRWTIVGVIGSIERRPDEEAEAIRQRLRAEAPGARR